MALPVCHIQLCRVLLLLSGLLAIAPAGRTALLPPKDHYRALGLERSAKLEDVEAAHQHFRNRLADKIDLPDARQRLVEIQHAFHVLSHGVRRRDYDIYGLDELEDIAREVLSNYTAAGPEAVVQSWNLPPVEPIESATTDLTREFFLNSVLNSTETWIILLYSTASQRSREFALSWEKLSKRFEGVARLARVELGDFQLAVLLSEKNWVTRYPHFPQGFPEIVVFRPSCQKLECLARYLGPLTWLDVEDWVSTKLLKFPRILYHSPISLFNDFIPKASPSKVTVVSLSNTGERAAPFVRQAAKTYREYAVFGVALWQLENETFWETSLGVEAAPALLFLKDPGLKPVIYYGEMNGSAFGQLVEEHKSHALCQLRSISATELGCNPAGYSLAGNETSIWYCVILAGKPGFQLNYKRQILREVQEILARELLHPGNHQILDDIAVAASAFREKRLNLVWLDGEAQKHFCYFYLHGESMMEACGPRRYVEKDDIPKIFMVRFERADQTGLQQIRSPNLWQALIEEDRNLAFQIVTKYNGSETSSAIARWISKMVQEGDTAVDLPRFKGKSPPLAPEELPAIWSQGQDYVSERTETLYRNGKRYVFGLLYIVRQPTTSMLLVALLLVYCTAFLIKITQNRQRKSTAQNVVTPGEVRGTVSHAEAISSGIRKEATKGLRQRK